MNWTLLRSMLNALGKGKVLLLYFLKSGFTNGLKELAEKGKVRLESLEEMHR